MNISEHTAIRRFNVYVFVLGLPFVLACNLVSGLYFPANPIAFATSTWTPTAMFTPSLMPTTTAVPTATEIPTVCGGPRTMFILLIGSDARSNTYNVGLADAIRILRVDFVRPGVQALAFPRDLYVEIPGIEDHGITHGKLNQAFLYGNPGYGYSDNPDLGSGLLANTIAINFDITAEHYLAVNLQTFSRVVDAIGGVDIKLPYIVDGRVKGSFDNNRYFPAGKQHLNGYRTMLLARMRPNGDLKRSEIQNMILQTLAAKLISPSTIPQLPSLAEAFTDSVQTNINALEIGQLICLAAMLKSQDIRFVSFPDDLFKSARVQDPVLGRTSILEADFNVLRSYVQRFEAGKWNAENGRDVEIAP